MAEFLRENLGSHYNVLLRARRRVGSHVSVRGIAKNSMTVSARAELPST
jgi:hypothetical protein